MTPCVLRFGPILCHPAIEEQCTSQNVLTLDLHVLAQETTAVERWPETSMHPHSRGQAGPEDDVLEAYVERRSRAGSRMPTARGMTSAAGGVTGLGDVSDARGQTRSRTALGMHRETRTASAAGLRSSSGLCRSSSALGQVSVTVSRLRLCVCVCLCHDSSHSRNRRMCNNKSCNLKRTVILRSVLQIYACQKMTSTKRYRSKQQP